MLVTQISILPIATLGDKTSRKIMQNDHRYNWLTKTWRIKIGIKFVTFFSKLTEMMSRIADYLKPLAGNSNIVQDVVVQEVCYLICWWSRTHPV